MSALDPVPQIRRSQLQHIRAAFLRLHKALLDSERALYEKCYGRIPSPAAFFQLVIGHEWFNWLRPMSQFIVQIDTALAAPEPITSEQAEQFLTTARNLIRPADNGTLPEQRYYQAIQRDPTITILHVEMSELLDLFTN